MSGTLIPLMGTAVDPYKPMQAWQNVLATEANRYKTNAETATEQQRPALVQAQTGLAGAQTGLVGAQTTGAQIQNALQGLIFQYRGGALDPSVAGGGTNGSGYQIFPQGNNTGTGIDLVTPSAASGGGTAAAGGGGVGPAAAAGGVGGKTAADVPPVGADATGGGVTSGNALAAYSTTSEPVAPGAPGAPAAPAAPNALTPPPAAQVDPSMQTSPNGMIHPLIGVPLPRQLVYGVLGSPDLAKAASEAQASRRAYLANAAASTTDLATWNAAVQREFSLGYITRGDAQALYGNFQYRDAVIRANASPDTQVGYNQAMTGHGLQESPTGPQLSPTALAVKPPVEQEIQVPVVGTDGKTYTVTRKISVPAGSYAASTLAAQGGPGGMGGGAGGGAAGGPPGGAAASPNATPVGAYLDKVIQPESGGNPNAKNPNSSAGGLLQFTDDSWLKTIKAARPDLAQGKTDAQLLALKMDPTLNKEMGVPYTQANLARLGELGIPQNEATGHLAHWFGPDGASTLLHAPQATPIGKLFDADLLARNKLNPNTPAGDLIRSEVGKFGLKSIDFGAGGSMSLVGGGGAPAATPSVGPSPGGGSPAAGGVAAGGAGGATVVPAAAGGPTLGANPTGLALPPGTSVGQETLTPEQQAGLNTRQAVQQAQQLVPVEAAKAAAVAGATAPIETRKAIDIAAGTAPIEVAKAASLVPIHVAEEEQKGTAKAYADQATQVIANATAAPVTLERLDSLENAAEAFRTGSTGPTRLAAYKSMVDAIQAMGGTPPAWMTADATGGEVINKLGGFLAAQMVQKMGEKAARVFDAVKTITPNIEQSTGGYKAVLESMRQDVTRDRDLGNFQDQWLADPSHNRSVAGMMTQFNKAYPIEAYASRVIPYAWPKSSDGLINNVIYQTEPGSKMRKDGFTRAVYDATSKQMHGMP